MSKVETGPIAPVLPPGFTGTALHTPEYLQEPLRVIPNENCWINGPTAPVITSILDGYSDSWKNLPGHTILDYPSNEPLHVAGTPVWDSETTDPGLSAHDYNIRRRLEVWKLVQNVVSYLFGNGLAAMSGYYMRVASPEMRDVFLYNGDNIIGSALIHLNVEQDYWKRLDDPAVDSVLTSRGAKFNEYASETKLGFAYVNTVLSLWETWRSRGDRVIAAARAGSALRSVGDIVEKHAIIKASSLWNSQQATINLANGFQINAVNAMALSQLAVIGGSAAAIALNIPLLIRELRRKGSSSILFMETVNSIGSGVCNIIMSGMTLYCYANVTGLDHVIGAAFFAPQPESPDELETQFKILNQVFQSRSALLYVNMGLMIFLNGYVIKSQWQSLKEAIATGDKASRNSLIPRILAMTCNLVSAPCFSIPALLPAGSALASAAGGLFATSLFIKHKDYLRDSFRHMMSSAQKYAGKIVGSSKA